MCVGLLTLAFLAWSECGHHKETPIFHLETRGKSKFKTVVVYRVRLATREMVIGEFPLYKNFP